MKIFYLSIGTHPSTKQSCGVNVPLNCWKEINVLDDKYAGLKGEIHLRLHGNWWEKVSPEKIQMLLINWQCNQFYPQISIVL